MTDIRFTIEEFVELLVSSLLAGAITGTGLAYLYLRFLRRKFRRQQEQEQELHDEEQNRDKGENKESSSRGTDETILIRANISRQTPTIPIQDPPDEENPAILNYEPNASAREEAGTSDRPEVGSHGRKTPEMPLASSPLSAVAVVPSLRPSMSLSLSPSRPSSDHIHAYPPTRQTSPTTPIQYSRVSRPTIQQDSIFPRRMSTSQVDGGTGSVADTTLSRTTTNVSTLPAYDTLSTGPPRYSSRSRATSSPSMSVSGDHPNPSGPYPPMPVDRWWIKQDGQDDGEVGSEV